MSRRWCRRHSPRARRRRAVQAGRGALARSVRNTLHLDILDEVEASVVTAERSNGRSLWRRLFDRR
ncbi:Nucleotide-binding protein, UspA family [Halapricum desulfuricans]|uniref:Nucleotide-binding protein, UspA family n=1 Tax=Halapricum desulfuricans TaxID=2841257 RepID=A0A897NFR9_9EURY|nr:Nucleotide-binding protein, UspA family [Halapricum desulfuricans]